MVIHFSYSSVENTLYLRTRTTKQGKKEKKREKKSNKNLYSFKIKNINDIAMLFFLLLQLS
jgi:hypothetical protein